MLLLGIAVVAGLVAGFLITHSDRSSILADYIVTMVGSTIVSLIIAFVLSIFVTLWAPVSCTSPHPTGLIRLSSAPDSHYYVNSQYINQDLTYFYFTKDSDGAIISHSVRAGLGKIYENAGETPTVVTYSAETDLPWRLFMFMPTTWTCSVDFKVPPGTVQPSYQVG